MNSARAAKNVEDEPAAGRGGVEVLVERGEADVAAAKVGHGGDQVLQGSAEPVESRDDEGVAGGQERDAGSEIEPVGVLAGELLGEDAPAAGGAQRVELLLSETEVLCTAD